MIERVTVIEFRMDNGGGNGADCFEVEIWVDTANFMNAQHMRYSQTHDNY